MQLSRSCVDLTTAAQPPAQQTANNQRFKCKGVTYSTDKGMWERAEQRGKRADDSWCKFYANKIYRGRGESQAREATRESRGHDMGRLIR
eukprot:446835-Pelagomonas_calceolata.AAC.2